MGIHWVDVQPGMWQWLEDYVYVGMATYIIGCPHDRRCRVGSGLFFGGMPHGEQQIFSGDIEHTGLGGGSLHVKIEDDGGPCRIGFYRRDASLIKVPIYPLPHIGS